MFSCISFFSYASGEDSTKTKYDINDPRNPNCPCHQYQKIADEEYQRQIANQHVNKSSKEVSQKVVSIRNDEMNLDFGDVGELNTKSAKASGSELKKVKVKRSVFARHSVVQHKNHKPKKRKVRFGKKDNSRCMNW